MLKKIGIACLIATALTSCDQNIVANIYVRDIQDLIAQPAGGKPVPVNLDLEVQAPGLRDKCDKPEIKEMVAAVGSYFDSATLAGCEQVKGAMYDVMKIKATTVMEVVEEGASVEQKQLVRFVVSRPAPAKGIPSAGVFAQFNRQAYDELNIRLRSINMMAQLKTEEARFTVALNNDTRDQVKWFAEPGNWYDGIPLANFGEDKTVDQRAVLSIKLGDVNTAALTTGGLVQIGAYSPATTQ